MVRVCLISLCLLAPFGCQFSPGPSASGQIACLPDGSCPGSGCVCVGGLVCAPVDPRADPRSCA